MIATDVALDEMRANAENVALELLALQSPVASDLRTVVSALWIVADCSGWARWPSTSPRPPAGGTRRR